MRQRIKDILKKAEAMANLQHEYNFQRDRFEDAIVGLASESNTDALAALEKVFNAVRRVQNANERDLYQILVRKLKRLYEVSVKTAEAKRKEFEDESREWYQLQGRYLSRKDSLHAQKQLQKDNKFKTKQNDWDTKRQNYYYFLYDLHQGRIEQQVLNSVIEYVQSCFNTMENMAGQLDGIDGEVQSLTLGAKNAEKDFEVVRTGRQEARRALASGSKHTSPSDGSSSPHKMAELLKKPFSNSDVDELSTPVSSDFLQSPASPKPRDGTNAKESGREGIIYGTSKLHIGENILPMTQWHKFWVTVSGSQLCEYQNWKTSAMELRGEPLNLRIATVREARSAERRFCFEIITPSVTRVYQATSGEDLTGWISAVQNAIETGLEQEALQPKASKSVPAEIPKKSRPLSRIFSKQPKEEAPVAVEPPTNTVERKGALDTLDNSFKNIQLFQQEIQENQLCADCASKTKVEWVSINIGCILCIGWVFHNLKDDINFARMRGRPSRSRVAYQ